MKIVIASGTPYHPLGNSGPPINFKGIAEALVARGHRVVLVARAPLARGHAQIMEQLRSQGVAVESRDGADIFEKDGYLVHGVFEQHDVQKHLEQVVSEFSPDGVLVGCSCWAPGDVTLLASDVLWNHGCPIGYLVVGMTDIPFGPLSVTSSPENQRAFARADRLFSVCKYVDTQLRSLCDYTSEVYYVPSYGAGPFPELVNQDGFVTLINACEFKGLPILLGLAKAMPDVRFAAVKGWGTTARDLEMISEHRNIEVLEFNPEINEILRQCKVVLTPSLIPEGFPLVTVEAMLRGVPVISSDSGGLPETKLGTEPIIPVPHVKEYAAVVDDTGWPRPILEAIEIGPWVEAVRRMVDDSEYFAAKSKEARQVATTFVASLGVEPLERLFNEPVRR